MILSDFTEANLATEIVSVNPSNLQYNLRYAYTTSMSAGTGTFKIRLHNSATGTGTDYTIAYTLQNASPPTFSSTPTASVTVIEKVVSSFTYPSIVAG